MRYSGTYAIFLALHLITVAFVIGPAAVAPPLAARAAREGRVQALRDHARTTRLYALASLVTVLLGTVLVSLGGVGSQWEFSEVWVSASYALWLLAVALLLAVVGPAQNAAITALDDGKDAGSFAGRISAAGGLAALALTVIIVLMVFKPGT